MSKFEETSTIEAVLHSMAEEGHCIEETGDCTENGRWWGKLEGPWNKKDVEEHGYLRVPERRELMSAAGAIVTENDSGFKDYELFQTRAELESAWAEIETEMEEYDREVEAEEEGEEDADS